MLHLCIVCGLVVSFCVVFVFFCFFVFLQNIKFIDHRIDSGSKMKFLFLFIFTYIFTCQGIRVGTLANHNPDAWKSGCGETGSFERVKCNLNVYENAASMAKSNKVDIFVFPEEYGLSSKPTKDGYFEPYDPENLISSTPCSFGNDSVITKLSCLAKNNSLLLATNVFTELKNGTRRITEIVFDSMGMVIAVYDKHHLFFILEPSIFEPGPFHPTSFSYENETFGLAICYEGFYPYITNDFSQFEALKDMNVTTLLWSVGGSAISSALDEDAKSLSKKLKFNVFASEDSELLKKPSVALYDNSGHEMKYFDSTVLDLSHLGYSGDAFIRSADL